MLGLHCCAQAFSSCSEWGLLSTCGAQASHCSGFSCCGARALEQRLVGLIALRHVGSSQTRDWTHVPYAGRQILNHWTTKGVPLSPIFATSFETFLSSGGLYIAEIYFLQLGKLELWNQRAAMIWICERPPLGSILMEQKGCKPAVWPQATNPICEGSSLMT